MIYPDLNPLADIENLDTSQLEGIYSGQLLGSSNDSMCSLVKTLWGKKGGKKSLLSRAFFASVLKRPNCVAKIKLFTTQSRLWKERP